MNPPPGSTKLALKVVPSSSRSGIAGWMGDALKVRVTAPPERGKANAAVVELLAEILDVQQSSIRVVSGVAQARKVVEIEGLSEQELRTRLARHRDLSD